ncbi:hypothetical protein PQO03_02565 [Lentisphaera profundi]|uniref:BON domain-containing protein n=1 Tax=Lentisphaera profundi TaxID=1658616 RepID=A0ABY7VRL4_9BACT|nr:hypothetical protein [Lentisphaera profundi]WDE96843.1 hypothetical protein PQO03_02565 [Lentisphaera profundi]
MKEEKKHIGSKAFQKTIFIVFILGTIGLIWAALFSPSAKQRNNLVIAEKFNKESLSPLIKKHQKSHDIHTGIYTGKGGCLAVTGWTETKKDLNDLKKIIEDINPPLPIRWTVKVYEIEFKQLENEE